MKGQAMAKESNLDLQAQTVYMLEQWGNWKLARDGARGYPTESAFSKATAPGVMSTGTIDDETGEKIDAIVSSLTRFNAPYKQVAILSFHEKVSVNEMQRFNRKLTPAIARTYRNFVIAYVCSGLYGIN